MSKDDVKV